MTKRQQIKLKLKNLSDYSDRRIAKLVECSHVLVGRVRREFHYEATVRRGIDGKERRLSHRGIEVRLKSQLDSLEETLKQIPLTDDAGRKLLKKWVTEINERTVKYM